MSDPTRTTGATKAQIEEGFERRASAHPHWSEDGRMAWRHMFISYADAVLPFVVPPDQCIVPRSFVDAVDAAIDKAEELDYHKLIPLKQWEAVENARDTFREGTS